MAKKSIKESPALMFFDKETPTAEAVNKEPVKAVAEAQTQDKTKSQIFADMLEKPKFETRSRRMQIVIQPSVHDELIAKAESLGISKNEAVIRAVMDWICKEGK